MSSYLQTAREIAAAAVSAGLLTFPEDRRCQEPGCQQRRHARSLFCYPHAHTRAEAERERRRLKRRTPRLIICPR